MGLVDASEVGKLHLTGPDAADVLQSVLTNDVKRLQPGQGCFAALLNDVGRMQSFMAVLRDSDSFWLETPPGLGPHTAALIEHYIITEDAAIRDATEDLALLSLQGPQSGAALESLFGHPVDLPHELDHHSERGLRVVRRSRTGEQGYDIWAPAAVSNPLRAAMQAAGAVEVSAADAETLRIEAGLPRFGVDMGDANNPLEANLMHAVSETKGCYLGQEVVARIINLSRPVRRLVGLLTQPPGLLSPGERLSRDGKEVGWVTSAAASPTLGRPVAMGYVRSDVIAQQARLTARDGALEVTVAELPLYLSPHGGGPPYSAPFVQGERPRLPLT
jgi:folate-binding protein YgfZ